jgi:hypothetical protein
LIADSPQLVLPVRITAPSNDSGPCCNLRQEIAPLIPASIRRKGDGMRLVTTSVCLAALAFGMLAMTSALAADDDLIGHWSFDEPGAAVAKDSSPGGHDGTIHGAVATQGILGGALQLDGTGDYVAPSLQGELQRVRVYGRYLRTSEAIAGFHAGP